MTHVLLTTDVVGGVWDFSLALSRALADSRFARVTLFALGTPSAHQIDQAHQAQAALIAEPLKLEWMQDAEADVAATRRVVSRLVNQLRPDVVHANQFAAACVDTRVPVVLTLHSDVLSWRRWTLGTSDVPSDWAPYVGLVREALRRADTVVAVSRFLAQQVCDLYDFSGRVEVIHNGWPAPPSIAAQREPITLLAGRVWDAAKNIGLAAEAAQSGDFGAIYVAGEITHPEGGESLLSKPLQPLGFLDRATLDQWLDRAAIYLSPARYDPFGLLPLQAALHGCALVLSDIPSYRELWDGAATFFSLEDVHDLQTAWRAALADPKPGAKRARQRACERYSGERMADTYAGLYARVPV